MQHIGVWCVVERGSVWCDGNLVMAVIWQLAARIGIGAAQRRVDKGAKRACRSQQPLEVLRGPVADLQPPYNILHYGLREVVGLV